MGKKNKTFKLKEYKVPQEKYVVVVNPWGLPERLDNNPRLNEIGVWFQFLLKKDYPEARVREIFYQRTHRNIIVVLPREIDINKYLGGYKYSQFHKFIPPEDTRFVYIYEYRYSKFGNPGKTNWTDIVPSNENIPTGLLHVLKDPFPFPSPAPLPPSDIGYARPIPPEIQNILSTVSLVTSTSEDKGKGKSTEVSNPSPPTPPPAPNVGSSSSCSFNQASTSTASLFTPYEPPSHYRAHVEASKGRIDQEHVAHEPQVKKMDPYEEEEVEKGLLRSLSPVKKEESNELEATDFLSSFLLSTSEEKSSTFSKSISRTALTFDDEGDYKPSPELLDLFSKLPDGLSSTTRKDAVVKSESEIVNDTVLRYDGDSSSGDRKDSDVIIKSEVVETKFIPDEEYRPSDELLEAFSNLTQNAGHEGPSIKLEPEGSVSARSSLSDRKQFPKPSTSRTTMETPRQPAPDNSRYNSNVEVKPEPVDSKVFFQVSSTGNRHFPVPRDRQRSIFPPSNDGNSQSSRDPRKRPMSSIRNEIKLEAEEEESGKRLKMEH